MTDGALRCSRYAFGPNRLHYCGPDANSELFAYIDNDAADQGLVGILKEFSTMYPYLRFIAEANKLRDPFDDRVVEAYWIGNSLLDNVKIRPFFNHLRDDHRLGKRLGVKGLDMLGEKVSRGAVPHHSFHVFDVWKRTGHLERDHTLASMDACRISWGTVLGVEGPHINVTTQPLVLHSGKLALGAAITKKVTRDLSAELDIDSLQPGHILTMHWGVPCEAISAPQAAELKRRTLSHIQFANETL